MAQLGRSRYKSLNFAIVLLFVAKQSFNLYRSIRQFLSFPQLSLFSLQGWEFAISLFTLSHKIALLKERPWVIRSRRSLKTSDESESVFNKERREWFTRFLRTNRTFALSLSKIERFARNNSLFSPCFWQFFTAFPIVMPKSESLSIKSIRERFALGKERIAILLFCSKTLAIRTKNLSANSQPCCSEGTGSKWLSWNSEFRYFAPTLARLSEMICIWPTLR